MPEPNKTLTNLSLATLNGSITDTEISSLTGGNLAVDASGNLSLEQGAGSGLNADLLDGVDSTAFLQPADTISGQVSLSDGSATVDTGVSATDATFTLALGIDDPAADCKVSGRLFWDDTAGTYKVEIVEQETSVSTPTVNYDILRIR